MYVLRKNAPDWLHLYELDSVNSFQPAVQHLHNNIKFTS